VKVLPIANRQRLINGDNSQTRLSTGIFGCWFLVGVDLSNEVSLQFLVFSLEK